MVGSSSHRQAAVMAELGGPLVDKVEDMQGTFLRPDVDPLYFLGILRKEPSHRPPILPCTEAVERELAGWLRICEKDGPRAEAPRDPRLRYEFCSLDLLKRVLIAEVAKSRSKDQALAVLSLALDRERLIVLARDVLPEEEAVDLVCKKGPGAHSLIPLYVEELRASLKVEEEENAGKKRRKRTRRRKPLKDYKETSPATITQKEVKEEKEECPFRWQGVWELPVPRRPGAEGVSSDDAVEGRQDCREYIPSMEAMEALRRSSSGGGMVTIGREAEVGEGSASSETTTSGESEEGRECHERAEGVNTDRGLCERETEDNLPPLLNTEKERRLEDNSRLTSCQQISPTPQVYINRHQGCEASSLEVIPPGESGPPERIPPGGDGSIGETLPRCSDGRCSGRVAGVALRPEHLPLHIHKDHWVGNETTQEKIRHSSSVICRRHTLGGDIGEETEVSSCPSEEVLQETRDCTLDEDVTRTQYESGVSGIRMGRHPEDVRSGQQEKNRVQTRPEELVVKTPVQSNMEKDRGQTPVFKGGSCPDASTSKASDEANEDEMERQEKSIRRSSTGPKMVEGAAEEGSEILPGREECIGDSGDRCIQRRVRSHVRAMEPRPKRCASPSEERNSPSRGHRQTPAYKCARAQSSEGDNRETQGSYEGEEADLVDRLHDCKSVSCTPRLSEDIRCGMEGDQSDLGPPPGTGYSISPSTRAGSAECSSRRVVKTSRGQDRVGESARKDNEQVGSVRAGAVRLHRGSGNANRKTGVERKKNNPHTTGEEVTRGDQDVREDRTKTPTARSASSLEGTHSPSISSMEGIQLVEGVGTDKDRAHSARSPTIPRPLSVAEKKWTSSWLRSVTDKLWFRNLQPASQNQYKRQVQRYLNWVVDRERMSSTLPKNLEDYFCEVAKIQTGGNVERSYKLLLRCFKDQLTSQQEGHLRQVGKLVTKEANLINPSKQQAAVAIRLEELHRLVTEAKKVQLTHLEQLALEILVISFCSVSRGHEIADLQVEDVEEDGKSVWILPKTHGKEGLKVKKTIKGDRILHPVKFLKERRKRAVEKGKKFLFRASDRMDTGMTTDVISNALKDLAGKMGLELRVTAHSARKGAATEAILKGIPDSVVMALGVWKQADSLQNYVADSIRTQSPLLSLFGDDGSEGDSNGDKSEGALE